MSSIIDRVLPLCFSCLDPDVPCGADRETPLFAAAACEHGHVVDFLLQNAKARFCGGGVKGIRGGVLFVWQVQAGRCGLKSLLPVRSHTPFPPEHVPPPRFGS